MSCLKNGALVFVGIVFLGLLMSHSNDDQDKSPQPDSTTQATSEQTNLKSFQPNQEIDFLSIAQKYRNQLSATKTELQESNIREIDQKKFCDYLHSLKNVNKWIGKIADVMSNFTVKVDLNPDNLSYDIGEKEKIDAYAILNIDSEDGRRKALRLNSGDSVVFSGEVTDNNYYPDCDMLFENQDGTQRIYRSFVGSDVKDWSELHIHVTPQSAEFSSTLSTD